MIIMLVVAPLTGVAYQLFDRSVKVEGWYYVNYYYLFFVLTPHLTLLTVLTGVFLLFPQDSKRAFFLIIPAGWHMAKIFWILTIGSNEDFYRLVPSSFFVLGGLAATVWLFTFNWMMSLHFHKRAGHLARAEGILQAPGVDPADKVRIATQEFAQYRKL